MAQGGAQLVEIEVQAAGDQRQIGVDVVVLLADQEAGDGGIVVDDEAVFAVEELAARQPGSGTLRMRFCSASTRKLVAPSTCSRHSPAASASIMSRMPYCTTASLTLEIFSPRADFVRSPFVCSLQNSCVLTFHSDPVTCALPIGSSVSYLESIEEGKEQPARWPSCQWL